MTPARKLTPAADARMASQRTGAEAGWTSDDVPDPRVPHYPDPVGERAAANVDRERNR